MRLVHKYVTFRLCVYVGAVEQVCCSDVQIGHSGICLNMSVVGDICLF